MTLPIPQRAFALLNHEAFHAYLANFVVSGESRRVPRWLNEGLAQVCESGVWEGETFRIDSPDKPALATFKEIHAVNAKLGVSTDSRLLTDLSGPSYTLVYELQFQVNVLCGSLVGY